MTTETFNRELKDQGLPPLMTKREVADLLGVTTRTIDRKVATGLLKPLKLSATRNGFVRFSRREIARFLTEAGGGE